MPFVTRKTFFVLILSAGIALLAVAGFVWSGIYNVGADDQHTRPVYAVLEALRERSIEARASKLGVPALDDPARIAQGAGNYDAMCTGCHLKPGTTATELSKGLYPAPPDLTKQAVDAAEAFWVIKHGIKASGMPAWGKSMEDEYIWNMVAFLQELPELDAAQYRALVARSGGHSHGGGETDAHPHAEGPADGQAHAADTDHAHPEGEGEAHPASAAPPPRAVEESAGSTHVHADGKRHVHAAKPVQTESGAAQPDAATQPASEPEPVSEPQAAEEEHHDHQH